VKHRFYNNIIAVQKAKVASRWNSPVFRHQA